MQAFFLPGKILYCPVASVMSVTACTDWQRLIYLLIAGQVSWAKAVIDGDVIVGGLFPVHHSTGQSKDYCSGLQQDRGIERLEAMLFTIDEINR